VFWVRRATLRERRLKDPAERLLALLLRVLARDVRLEDVATQVRLGERARG
jgi:hypothetical protein